MNNNNKIFLKLKINCKKIKKISKMILVRLNNKYRIYKWNFKIKLNNIKIQ